MAEKKACRVIELPPDQMAIVEQAVAKLENKDRGKPLGSYAKAVYSSVVKTLVDFCYQSPDLAQVILDSDKSVVDCCEAIMKNVGNCISDLEVYRRAVQFFCPKSQIDMQMRVILSDQKPSQDAPKVKPAVILNLLDL